MIDIWYFGYSDDGTKAVWFNPMLSSYDVTTDSRVTSEDKQKIMDSFVPTYEKDGLTYSSVVRFNVVTKDILVQHIVGSPIKARGKGIDYGDTVTIDLT